MEFIRISLGIDMFDCVIPTRNARNSMLFTWDGIINLKNQKWKNDFSPLDELGCSYVDSFYSKSYVRHLLISKELLGIINYKYSQFSILFRLG